MATNEAANAPKGRAKAAQESPKTVPESLIDGAPQREEGGSSPEVNSPPREERSHDVTVSPESQREASPKGTEARGNSARARAPDGKNDAGAGLNSRDGSSNAHGVTTRRRGRRRVRTEAQAEQEYDRIRRDVLAARIDSKAGAVAIQALNGQTAVMRYRRDLDFEKRMEAIEARLGAARKRGGDA
jgi:hypothetical protein